MQKASASSSASWLKGATSAANSCVSKSRTMTMPAKHTTTNRERTRRLTPDFIVASWALHVDLLDWLRRARPVCERRSCMIIGKRIYWVAALVAVLALAGAAITVTSRLTSAGSTPTAEVQTCDQEDEADDEAERAVEEADTDDIEEQCGDQNEVEDANEAEDGDAPAASGTLDDGKDLLSEAVITIDAPRRAGHSGAPR